MYSWRERADTTVVDEPFYAHYLAHTELPHPGRDDVIASQPSDAREVLDSLLAREDRPVLVAKQMAHHLRGLSTEVRAGLHRDFRQVLLIREPALVVRSYAHQVAAPTLDDLGYLELVELLDAALDAGRDPIVVDSADLLADPPGVIAALCERLGLAMDRSMLSWPAGPKPEDGIWAPHWYAGVHASTGFAPPRPAPADALPPHLAAIADEARPLHDHLRAHRLT